MAAEQSKAGSASRAAEIAPPIRPRAADAFDAALREGRLDLWYQPKIDLRRKRLAGAEALARIRDSAGGVVLPERFLPGLDECGLARLAEHALIAALEDWRVFDEAGFNLRLAINVPVSALARLPIAEIVADNRPLAPHWPGLTVEVTEDQIVRDIRRSQEIATRLRACGIAVSIDDFGAGYSSFAGLRELAFAEIKLNHSFVKDCATDATNAAICQTAIDLAHRFGSAAVAEGIESIADLEALQIMGCDFGQGVLLAPPMPKERFLDLLQARSAQPPPGESRARAAAGA